MSPEEMTVFEAIHSVRAVRIYKPDPVEPEKIARVLRAGTFATNAGNVQPWEFLVITRPEIKAKLKEIATPAFHFIDQNGRVQTREQLLDGAGRRVSGHDALEYMDKVPVLIMCFYNPVRGRRMKDEWRWFEEHAGRGGSVFPAIQNMVVAAHALGLGTVVTTLMLLREYDAKKLLGVPEHLQMVAMVYLGYSAEKLGKPRRLPIEQVTRLNSWDTPFSVEALSPGK